MTVRRRKEVARFAAVLVLLVSVGCEDVHDSSGDDPEAVPVALGSDFDPATAGEVRGRVTWTGPMPTVAPLEILVNPFGGPALRERQVRPNPNAPVIDAATRGVGNAVVYLRQVDPARSRPWDHPPVRVEQRGLDIHIRQGGPEVRCGFVRRGDSVEIVSQDEFFYSLHASGAVFFTLMFPDPHQALERRLDEKGLVELTSASGCYWMRGHLFVDDHPYFSRTDGEGRFSLPDVPPGSYEVVCWTPNWNEARHERDPESGVVCRYVFEPPVERVRPVVVAPGASAEVSFTLAAKHFQ